MGLNASWQKIKVQCFSKVLPPLASISVRGQQVYDVNQFCYLGSTLDSSGRCKPDVLRWIGIVSSFMNSLSRVWSAYGLSSSTKFKVYQACIISVLLYGSETWTLLSSDARGSSPSLSHALSKAYTSEVRWQDRVRNVVISERSGLPDITDIIESRRTALFGHVVRLPDCVPAHPSSKDSCRRAHWPTPVSQLEAPAWKAPGHLA